MNTWDYIVWNYTIINTTRDSTIPGAVTSDIVFGGAAPRSRTEGQPTSPSLQPGQETRLSTEVTADILFLPNFLPSPPSPYFLFPVYPPDASTTRPQYSNASEVRTGRIQYIDI